MIKGLWNIGLKADDLDKEVEFLQAVGAKCVLRDRLPYGSEYVVLELGGHRMLVFSPKVVFEDQIPEEVRPGLTHACTKSMILTASSRKSRLWEPRY